MRLSYGCHMAILALVLHIQTPSSRDAAWWHSVISLVSLKAPLILGEDWSRPEKRLGEEVDSGF
jgi:hypothetical protein